MHTDAVELSADGAWFLADLLGAGSFPWVLAITPPYADLSQRPAFDTHQADTLSRMGVLRPDGTVEPPVARWIRLVCRPFQWVELRCVAPRAAMLRGIVARDASGTVVALRSGRLVTFTAVDVDHPQALARVVTAGLTGAPPARFDPFTLPARAGAAADQKIRDGAPLPGLLDHLGIPPSARPVVVAAFEDAGTSVEVIAGQHRDGHRVSTDVGVTIVDTACGRVLVSPSKAPDGQWISTFSPGTVPAIAAAVERLTAALPDGPWFPDHPVTRDFDERQKQPCRPL